MGFSDDFVWGAAASAYQTEGAVTEEDMKLISEPIDIYGQNIYNGRCIHM